MIGRTVSHFRILAELGSGGVGVVYQAVDTRLDRKVAIKFLHPHMTTDADARSRFIREAKAASSLEHPSICSVYEIGETDDGLTFMVMPCYGGSTLEDLIVQGPFAVDQALEVANQVARGLAKAHDQGIVHRDIKPANIFLTVDGQAVILDFGLAKLAGQTRLTRDGTTMGTVAYMSPEQARGQESDDASDIWALGAVLYEMLTGVPAFGGEHPQAVIYAIQNLDPDPVSNHRDDIPETVAELTHGLLSRDALQRRQGLAALAQRSVSFRELSGGSSVDPKPPPRRPWALVAAVAALAVVAVVIKLAPLGSGTIDSIAVLPFENLSDDPEQEYFSDGMTDQLISGLGSIGVFEKVISRRSVMSYKGQNKPIRDIADDLGVQVLVEGTVIMVGDRARVTAYLIDGDRDRQLWTETYDESLADILNLQSRIVGSILTAIEVTMSPAIAASLTESRPVNPRAHRAYLRGTHWLNNAKTEEEYLLIPAAFEEAIDADSTYAPAYAGLAEYHVKRTHTTTGIPPVDAIPQARANLDRALDLDPNLAEAYMTQGHLFWEHEFKVKEAEVSLLKALELNPSLAWAHLLFAYYLSSLERYDEALAEARRVIELDPLSLACHEYAVFPLIAAGRYEEAEAQIMATRERFPSWEGWRLSLAQVYSGQKAWQKTIELAEEGDGYKQDPEIALNYAVLQMKAGNVTAALGVFAEFEGVAQKDSLYYRLGQTCIELGMTEKARNYLVRYKQSDKANPYSLAMLHAPLGDIDQAFAYLDQAFELRINWLTRARLWKNDPFLDALTSDPRYDELLARIGIGP